MTLSRVQQVDPCPMVMDEDARRIFAAKKAALRQRSPAGHRGWRAASRAMCWRCCACCMQPGRGRLNPTPLL